MIKTLLYFLLVGILFILYIFTNTYYLLVITVLLLLIKIICIILMLIHSHSIHIKIVEIYNQLFIQYNSKSKFPFGRLKLELNFYNHFFEENNNKNIYFLVGDKNIEFPIDIINGKIGKYEIKKYKCKLYDILGMSSKRIKNISLESFYQLPKYIELNNYNELLFYIREKHSNDNEDYDIKEYRIGDSIKDIHYKVSYKLSKLMTKEKINTIDDISVYIDLSGNEDECNKVFSYLYCLIESIQIYKKKCNVYWHSKTILNQYTINHIDEFDLMINHILSMPKSKHYLPVQSYWLITSNGIFGGDDNER